VLELLLRAVDKRRLWIGDGFPGLVHVARQVEEHLGHEPLVGEWRQGFDRRIPERCLPVLSLQQRLRHHLLDDVTVNVCQPVIATLETVREPGVVETQKVHDRG